MKKIKFLIFNIFLLGVIILISSCEEDPCEFVFCENGGICNEGVCSDCNVGYEGERCTTLSRAKMMGDYSIGFVCTSTFGPEDATITPDANDNLKFIIDISTPNPLQYQLTMTGETTFDMPSQEVCDGCNNVQGSGSINTNTGIITINTITDSGNDSCIETLTPQ